jgi:hypothetical protein
MKGPRRSAVVVAGLLALLVSGLPAFAWAHESEPTLNLSMSPGVSRSPKVALSGSAVYVVWLESDALWFRRSLDGGRTFEPAVVLSGGGGASTPFLVALQDRVYVAWAETGIHFRVSTDRGASFGPILDLSLEPGGSPQLAVSGRHVYAVWRRDLGRERGDVLFRASHDEGRSFGPMLDLTPGTTLFGPARISARGGTVYVLWTDSGSNDNPQLFYRRSTNAGTSFEDALLLSGPNADVASGFDLALEGDFVYVIWRAGAKVFFARSLDEGATFEPSVNLGDSLGLTGVPAPLLVRDHRLYIATTSFAEGRQEILLTQSFDRGETFLASMNVSDSPGGSFAPQLVRAGSGARVFWLEGSFTDFDVYSRATRKAGPKLGPIENLSGTPGTSFEYAAASNGSRAHLVWSDDSDGDFDIYYRRLDAAAP